jgi:hypothetical protein
MFHVTNLTAGVANPKSGDPKAYKFPVPLRQRKNCDFSYAGLKTAVRMAIERDLGVGDTDAFTKVHVPGGQFRVAAAEGAEVKGQGEGEGEENVRGGSSESSGESSGGEEEEEEEGKIVEEARREQIKADIAASFQQSAVKHLEERTRRAVEWANDSLVGLYKLNPVHP